MAHLDDTIPIMETFEPKERGRRGGRPPALDKEGIRAAETMLKDTANYPFVGDVIDRLTISRAAFYRYFPPDRIRELRNQVRTLP
jgi:hypothetical protein